MEVRISSDARQDLRDIALFIARDNPRRALSFVEELERATVDLANHPERFALLPRYEQQGLRRRPVGHYLIVYLIEPEIVQVVRILSSWMDLDEALDA